MGNLFAQSNEIKYNACSFPRITKEEIIDVIDKLKKELGKTKQLIVDDDFIIYETTSNELNEVVMIKWNQFIEEATYGEELNYEKFRTKITNIILS